MLKKLFRHDFYALSRTLFPIQIGVLAGGLLATLLARFAIVFGRETVEGGPSVVMNGAAMGASVSGVALLVAAIFASLLVTTLLECLRFYHNLLGNEGYLTFTLPVSNAQILGSKLLTGVLWTVINLAAVAIAGTIFLVFGTADKTLMNPDVLDLFRGILTGIGDGGLPAAVLIPEMIVWGVTALFSQLMELYFAIIVGGQIAKKNKLLAAIGMYLVINFCVGLVKKIVTAMTGAGIGLGLIFSNATAMTSFSDTLGLIMLWGVLLNAGLTVAFFFWSRSLLNRNLNLQ